MTIREARAEDLPVLCDIEQAAGELFRPIGMTLVADDDPPTIAELAPYQRDGRAFVYASADDRPVGYLLVDPVDGHAHIAQVTVHPDHGRRGIGALLVDQARRWALARGMTTLSLTTFADVAWNAPYYARLGFTVLPAGELTAGLLAIRADEAARGLDRWPRVTMTRPADTPWL
ncbi:GNAT family N-acetyltransferase [Actinophytocola sediminis]